MHTTTQGEATDMVTVAGTNVFPESCSSIETKAALGLELTPDL